MAEKIRIATIITRLVRGGAQYIALQVHAALPEDKYEKYFICGNSAGTEGSYQDLADEKNIKPVIVPELIRDINLFKDIVAVFKIYRFLRKNKIKIVYTNTSKAGILGRVAAYFSGTKIIIHCPHGHIFAENSFIKGVCEYPLRKRMFLFLERIAAKISTKLIAYTRKEVNELLNLNIGKEAQYEIINNALDIDSFIGELVSVTEMKKELDISDDRFVVGIVGRLSAEKGHTVLFKAIAELKNKYDNICLLVVGDGPMFDELSELKSELKLDENIIMTGLKEDVSSYLNVFDLFVLSSFYEGFGMVIIEAMAMGKPVIATGVGGVPEIMLDGETGILIPPDSIKSMVENIELLMQDKQKREAIAEAGREDVLKRYSLNSMIERYLSVFQSA